MERDCESRCLLGIPTNTTGETSGMGSSDRGTVLGQRQAARPIHYPDLAEREREVLTLIAQGWGNEAIATVWRALYGDFSHNEITRSGRHRLARTTAI